MLKLMETFTKWDLRLTGPSYRDASKNLHTDIVSSVKADPISWFVQVRGEVKIGEGYNIANKVSNDNRYFKYLETLRQVVNKRFRLSEIVKLVQERCQQFCDLTPDCTFWTWYKVHCDK